MKYYYHAPHRRLLAGSEEVLRRYHLDVPLSDSPAAALAAASQWHHARVEDARQRLREWMDRLTDRTADQRALETFIAHPAPPHFVPEPPSLPFPSSPAA